MELLQRVQMPRLVDDLWRLVNIASPTGHERQAATAFADMLRSAGAEVEIDTTLPDSPNVIGRLRGRRPGKTFQLAGHLDHIDVPHPPPCREADSIVARGAADMKNGLAGILEVVRVLHETGHDFAGQVLITAYGLHEAPVGNSAGLLNLIRDGIVGDAALVAECPCAGDGIVIAGKGQSIWNVTLRRLGQACHELRRPADADGLLALALKLADRLMSVDARAKAQPHDFPLLGPESLFVGQLHYGDFYNRSPVECRLQGTRRWHPSSRFADVQREFDALLADLQPPAGIAIESNWIFVGESYAIEPDEPVVQALRAAQHAITGRMPPYAGMSAICDSNRLAPLGNVPTVLFGFDNEFAHADVEKVRLERLVPACQVVLQTVLNYLECNADRSHK
jgi:acetylornithine deacetylase/succinyl-diaminopimelate desuccinylase-like protein